MTFIEDGNPLFVLQESEKLLNLHRLLQNAELLESVQIAQSVKYELKRIPAIQSILLNVHHVDIMQQEIASYKNEPQSEGGAVIRRK